MPRTQTPLPQSRLRTRRLSVLTARASEALLIVGVLLAAPACAGSSSQRFQDPSYMGHAFSAPVVVVRDESNERRAALERAVSGELRRSGVLTRTLSNPSSLETDQERLRDEGVDALIVMKAVPSQHSGQADSMSGSPACHTGPVHAGASAPSSGPSVLRAEVVDVTTTKIVWVSSSRRPASANDTESARRIAREMVADGLFTRASNHHPSQGSESEVEPR